MAEPALKAIVTIPPYADYIRDIARHPMVSGLRLNTVMPISEPLTDLLERIRDIIYPRTLWIDLKCRQLRVTNYATTPYQYLELSHKIELDIPKDNYPKAYFNDGLEFAHIARVDGNRLIMLEGPQRVVGPGESVNILDPSLRIKGYLTPKDLEYMEAAKSLGIHDYMISYLEEGQDIQSILNRDPKANILAKVESKKGMDFIGNKYRKWQDKVTLMAARGDLYVEIGRPHKILGALRDIIQQDPKAVAASRIFSSLRQSLVPSCPDITDIAFLHQLGYRELLIGDDICFNRESIIDALNLLQAIYDDFMSDK